MNWQSFARPAVDAGPAREKPIAEQYAEALAAPGFAGLAGLLDDDVHLSFPGMNDVHGKDGIVQAHDSLFGAFDSRRFAIGRIWRTTGERALEWTLTGVQARPWQGVAPTQKPVAIRGLTLLSTKDSGAISDVHVYFDVAVAKAQLGAGPKELEGLPAPVPPAGPPVMFGSADAGAPEGTGGEGVTVVKRALDALENANEPAFTGAFTDDAEVYSLERAEPARGRAEVRAYLKTMTKAIGQLDTTLVNGWSADQFAIVEYSITGEQLAPIGWVPVQKGPHVVRLRVAAVAEIKNDSIARLWRFDNPAQILVPGP